jgi:hypothetical protein
MPTATAIYGNQLKDAGWNSTNQVQIADFSLLIR